MTKSFTTYLQLAVMLSVLLLPVFSAHAEEDVVSDRQQMMNGTSMAAPLVAGIVALMLEIDPELTLDQIKRYIAMTATKIDDEPYVKRGYDTWNKYYGYGLINAFKAVLMASTYK